MYHIMYILFALMYSDDDSNSILSATAQVLSSILSEQ